MKGLPLQDLAERVPPGAQAGCSLLVGESFTESSMKPAAMDIVGYRSLEPARLVVWCKGPKRNPTICGHALLRDKPISF